METYLLSTFGITIQLAPDGIPLTAGGLPLFSDATTLVGLYSITEDIPNFKYTVTINASAQVDQAGLARELAASTPAHLSFNIVYTAQTQQQQLQKSGGAIATAKAGGTESTNISVVSTRSVIVTWAELRTP